MIRSFLLLLAIMGATLVAGTDLEAPVTGYVKDWRNGTLRPINGLPGASLLGAPAPLPFVINELRVCAKGDFALASESATSRRGSRRSQPVWLIQALHASNLSAARLPGILADQIALNESCTGALLYSENSRSLRFVTGLPNQPQVFQQVALSQLAGSVSALALSSDGKKALVGMSGGSAGGGVYLVDADSSVPVQIAQAAEPASLALFNADMDVSVADAATGEVFAVRSFATSRVRQSLLRPSDGLQRPVAVQVIGDSVLFAADAGARVLFQLDLSSGSIVNQFPLSVAPTRLERLSLLGVFALSDAGQSTLLLLDTMQEPKVMFVPRD